MRNALRAYRIDVALWLIAAAGTATIWLGRPALISAVVITAIVPTVCATARHREIHRLRRAAADIRAAHVAAAHADAVSRAAAIYALRESLTAQVNATIVEVVAATQAVVRAAHPDDVLVRLNAADDAAHTLLTTARNLSMPTPRAAGDRLADSGSVAPAAH